MTNLTRWIGLGLWWGGLLMPVLLLLIPARPDYGRIILLMVIQQWIVGMVVGWLFWRPKFLPPKADHDQLGFKLH